IFFIFFQVIAYQGNLIPFAILYGLLFMLAADVTGRCLHLLLFRKNHTKTVWITGTVFLLILTVLILFLLPDGFARGNTEKYARMQEAAGDAPAGFEASIAQGNTGVLTMTYGMGSCDLTSTALDLSPYAKRNFPESLLYKLRFDYEPDAVPLSGKIWYPDAPGPSPVLFIIHGNHDVDAESYLGYDYLGEYLASNGYALVSVDENSCNGLSAENDARAVLLLENVKQILAFNEDETSPLFGKLDTDKIALAGHSRGGEAICLAALFNDYDRYPENGNISFDYHFPITSLIAIAPVCDQYVPAGKTVRLTDVSYLLLHGLNDQDVSSVMGEKQYYNIDFSGKKDCFKSTVCLNGANHGQFNTLWGRYDYPEPTCRFLDVHDLLDADAQRRFLCAMAKTFLDVTVKGDRTYRSLFYDIESYKAALPDTAYQQVYADGTYTCRFDFDTQKDLGVGGGTNWKLSVDHCSEWTEKRRKATSDAEHGNCALAFRYGETEEKAVVTIKTGGVDLSDNLFAFDLADMREKKADLADAGAIAYHVIFTDEEGHTARIENPREILPSVGVQLYKPDALFGQYEYKHQFTTVRVSPDDCKKDGGFDASSVDEIKIVFDDPEGDLEIDEIGIAKKSDI
ncbi:MAG: hypothetical protein K6E16_11215, partial [Lachnospiraceae bacterium]|nr:hypothetical protein [Lachnospiraceae bacterium]